MGHVLGPLLLRDLHLTLGDHRPRQTVYKLHSGEKANKRTDASTQQGIVGELGVATRAGNRKKRSTLFRSCGDAVLAKNEVGAVYFSGRGLETCCSRKGAAGCPL